MTPQELRAGLLRLCVEYLRDNGADNLKNVYWALWVTDEELCKLRDRAEAKARRADTTF